MGLGSLGLFFWGLNNSECEWVEMNIPLLIFGGLFLLYALSLFDSEHIPSGIVACMFGSAVIVLAFVI
jgi:hypothetical protein